MADLRNQLAGRRVLILDDCEAITALLKEVFASCGAEVTAVNCGQTALMLLQCSSFDLLLLDLVMPSPNGWDILGFLQASRPDMLGRTVVLTGDQYHHSTLQHVYQARVRAVFKPFDVERLRQAAYQIVTAADAAA